MKFILIYGPPAAGKLTIAKELQTLTGYQLLHNHLVVDLVEAIDTERSAEFFSLHDKILTDVINFAIKKDKNIINTFVYAHGTRDDDFMRNVKEAVTANGGEIYFIQIMCSKDKLIERVVEPSRKSFGKISNADKLAGLLEQYDLETPFEDTFLTINNSDKTAVEVANEIIRAVGE